MTDNVWNERKSLNLWTAWRHYVPRRAVRFIRGCLWFIRSGRQFSAPLAICSHLQLVSSVFRHGSVCFKTPYISVYDIYMEYGPARNCRRIFRSKFHAKKVPSRKIIHNLANKRTSAGLLTDKKTKHKRLVLTERKLDDIGAWLEHTPRKSLKRLSQETGVSQSSSSRATQLLKLGPYKTTVIHTLQPRDPGNRVHLCSWFLQSVVEGEIDPQLIFLSDKGGFPCRDT
jgi:hypothetical protein